MASDTIEDEDDPETEISQGRPQSLKVNHLNPHGLGRWRDWGPRGPHQHDGGHGHGQGWEFMMSFKKVLGKVPWLRPNIPPLSANTHRHRPSTTNSQPSRWWRGPPRGQRDGRGARKWQDIQGGLTSLRPPHCRVQRERERQGQREEEWIERAWDRWRRASQQWLQGQVRMHRTQVGSLSSIRIRDKFKELCQP